MQEIPNLHNWRANLSDGALADLEKLLTTRKLTTDESLYSTGDPSVCGYQIITGRIKISNYSADGDEMIIANLQDGDCVGDLGLITGECRFNHASAICDTEINILNRNDFEQLCIKHPEIPMSINKLLSNRLRILFTMVEDAYLLPLYERLARTIVRLALSYGKHDDEGNTIVSDVSHETLGQMVGATRQSIGRELKKMSSQNMLRLEYSKLIIPDLTSMVEQFDHIISHEPIVPSYPLKPK